ncbi:hypothetical protein AAZX31_15G099200 [Glycine max]
MLSNFWRKHLNVLQIDGLLKGQALNNYGSIYADCGKLDLAKACYENALAIRHTKATNLIYYFT